MGKENLSLELAEKLAGLHKNIGVSGGWHDCHTDELAARHYRKVCDLVPNSLHPFAKLEIGFFQGSFDMWAVVAVAICNGRAWTFFAKDEWYFSLMEVGALLIGDARTLLFARWLDDLVALDGSGSTGIVPASTVCSIREACRLMYGDGDISAAMFETWMHFYLGEVAEEHKQEFRDGKLWRTESHRSHKLYAVVRRFLLGVDVKTCAEEACGRSASLPVQGLAELGISQIPVENGFASPYDDVVKYPPVGFDRQAYIDAGGRT